MSEKNPSRVTTDHGEIKKWVEDGGGYPVRVVGNSEKSLKLSFNHDGPEEGLEKISWEDFFEEFDRKRLAFLYQEDGDGRFFKLLSRDNA